MSSCGRNNPKDRPWLTPVEQVAHLKLKGVRFELMSEAEATDYLIRNGNYFRLRAYHTGFSKVEEGSRAGQYANLDFKMLVDLSVIDMLLRYEMLPLTLDIEHFVKVRLLNEIERQGEDGYAIVRDFISSYNNTCPDGTVSNRVCDEIEHSSSSPYLADLIHRYNPGYEFPAWSFVEVITFGTFLYFYRFCANRFDDRDLRDEFYLLQSVKSLRNACAHNNCILNDLVAGNPMYKPCHAVTQELGKVPGIGSEMRRSKMSNDRLQQITTVLYTHRLVASDGVSRHRAQSLSVFLDRMNRHPEYYAGNCQVLSSFDYLTKVIHAWFPLEA